MDITKIFHTKRKRNLLSKGMVLTLAPLDDPAATMSCTVDQPLAEGGFAVTYRVHGKDGRQMVLKEIYPLAVENGWIQRRSRDDRLVYVAVSGEEDEFYLENRFLGHLQKEAEMTLKAGTTSLGDLSFDTGDTLRATPMRSDAGNLYLLVETRVGLPLQNLIQSGWSDQKGLDGRRNVQVPVILDLLEKTAIVLSRLHQELYHLDLHPANIFVGAQGPELVPFIIDYGSAVNKNETPGADHLWTVNDHSAPELYPLSFYQNTNCGYEAGETADTYALASILFYVVTGKLWGKLKRKTPWQNWIADLYPEEAYGSFSTELCAFFREALSPWEEDRLSADKLSERLHSLGETLANASGLLKAMDQRERSAARLLFEYPLHHNRPSQDPMELWVLGTGPMAEAVVRIGLTCQVLDRQLNITVAGEDVDRFRAELESHCPALASFSNLSKDPEAVYANFKFRELPPLETLPVVCGQDPYLVVDLDNSKKSREYAEAVLAAWPGEEKPLIHYAVSDRVERTIPVSLSYALKKELGIKELNPHPFGYNSSAGSLFIQNLEEAALSIHLAYASPEDREDETKRFFGWPYGTRSSALAALSIPYKLESLRAVLPQLPGESPADYFCRAMEDPDLCNAMIYLEHIRWNCEKISDSYRRPDEDTVLSYACRGENKKMHSEREKWHPCLVHCDRNGSKLKENLDEEQSPDLDPLDQVSTNLHRLSKQIMDRNRPELEKHLAIAELLASSAPELVRELQNTVWAIFDGQGGDLSCFDSRFRAKNLDLSSQLVRIEENLRAAVLHHKHINYKLYDQDILKIIPTLLKNFS